MGKFTDLLPFWLLDPKLDLRFSEDDDDSGDDESQDDDADEDDEEEEDDKKKSKSSKGKSKDEDEDDEEDDPTQGLKSALKKERAQRKQFQRELKQLKRQQGAATKKSETDDKETQAAAEKVTKLAERLRENAVDTAIVKAVGRLELPDGKKFADIDDAIRLIDRAAIVVEQEDDDPDEIEIDSDSVVKALKRLAKNKPHLLVGTKAKDEDEDDDEDTEDEPKAQKSSTGSKVGSRGTRDKGKIKEDELRKRYPMLNR
jgi:hypothetical protein